MKNISFAWTTPALVTGNKTCTRRDWAIEYGSRFEDGELVQAFDRAPRFAGTPVGTIRLIEKPHTEWLSNMPDTDYQAEGFEWILAHPESLPGTIDGNPREAWVRSVCTRAGFDQWRRSGAGMWVVRFQLVGLTEYGEELKERYTAMATR